ncbi:MAG: formate dehydrogenase accessory sulfurtransferase FdhD [Candidatus Bipolaricaulaceae bacterium]
MAEEALVEVVVAGQSLTALVCTPFQVRELVYGHLAGLGLIRTAQEVLAYHEEWGFSGGIPGEHARISVHIKTAPRIWPREKLLWSSCESASFQALDLPRLSPRPIFPAAGLLDLPRRVLLHAERFKKTGAHHCAALFNPALEAIFFAEDIGRHNAVDKVLGAALLASQHLAEALLYTTGRVGTETVVKALRLGVPVVASPGAPLWGAVALAREHGLGLVGFLRGRRFNLYSGPDWFTP